MNNLKERTSLAKKWKILVPFYDDSSLFFALTIKNLLKKHGFDVFTAVNKNEKWALSERQLHDMLPEGFDTYFQSSMFQNNTIYSFDAIIEMRMSKLSKQYLQSSSEYYYDKARPASIMFQTGLDFTPELGLKNRRLADVVFCNSRKNVELFERKYRRNNKQLVRFGHPYFLKKSDYGAKQNKKDVYFFAQALSPNTLDGRLHMLEIMIALAAKYTDRDFYIKLRHLPNENKCHKHFELLSYSELAQGYYKDQLPANLKFTVGNINEVLKSAAMSITCTSTAAMDSIGAGVPTLIYLDYPQNHLDFSVKAIFSEFMNSGLLASKSDIMDLKLLTPNKQWLDNYFRNEEELINDINDAISDFKKTQVSINASCKCRMARINKSFFKIITMLLPPIIVLPARRIGRHLRLLLSKLRNVTS